MARQVMGDCCVCTPNHTHPNKELHMSTSMGEENHRRDQDRDRRADADGLIHHDPHDTGRTSPSKEHRPAGHDRAGHRDHAGR